MVGKGVGLHRQTEMIEVCEEALRVADPGDGVQVLAVKIGGVCNGVRVEQVVETCTVQSHGIFARRRLSAINDYRISLCHARWRLAQWPGGKQEAVAEAAHSIHHHDFDVAPQPVMLQAIIAEQNIAFRMGAQQCARGGSAIEERVGERGGRNVTIALISTFAVTTRSASLVLDAFNGRATSRDPEVRAEAPALFGDHPGAS